MLPVPAPEPAGKFLRSVFLRARRSCGVDDEVTGAVEGMAGERVLLM
jgi:hypothetical protein